MRAADGAGRPRSHRGRSRPRGLGARVGSHSVVNRRRPSPQRRSAGGGGARVKIHRRSSCFYLPLLLRATMY